MKNFTLFDTTGRVAGRLGIPEEDLLLYVEVGHDYVEGDYSGDKYYLINGQPTERPASPVSRTGPTLLDVPTGSTLYINGVSYPAEGEVEVLFTYPGTYALRVECFPYLDWTDEVVIP